MKASLIRQNRLTCELLEARQMLAATAVFDFDTNGAGSNPPGGVVTMDVFDWKPGNALAVGGNTAIENALLNQMDGGDRSTDFQLYYQASLSSLRLNNVSQPLFNLNAGDELTVVAGFTETVTSVAPGVAIFGFNAAKPSYLEIWYSSADSSDLSGTGFNNGTLILASTLESALGNFTLDSDVGPLDFFGIDNYDNGASTQLTLQNGIGGTTVTATVTAADPDFFLLPPGTSFDLQLFNTSQAIPFGQTDPSSQFLVGSEADGTSAGDAPVVAGAFVGGAGASLGQINGDLSAPFGTGMGGPDFQVQVDGNGSLTFAPQLIIEKTPDKDDVPPPVFGPGETAAFQIKVTNLGPGDANNVVVTDNLPEFDNSDTVGPLTWTVASENGVPVPPPGVCSIANPGTTNDLTCNVGDLAAGEMFTVVVETVIPDFASSSVIQLLPGTTFNATDGNLLLDNSEVPAGVGAPAMDTKDWETFAPGIDCSTNTGCVIDVPDPKLDDSYTMGAKEDDRSPATSFGSIPPSKDNLNRWYFVDESLGGDTFLYLAWVRNKELATATIDFELNQSGALTANGVNPVRTEGDVLITYDFQGGRVDELGFLRWLEDTTIHSDDDCEANNGSVAAGCWGNKVDLLDSGAAEGAVNFYDNGTNKPNDDGYPVFDPVINPGTGLPFGEIEQGRFGEAAINLSEALGEGDACRAFAQAFVKSRSSGSSFTSELKDFIRPVPVAIGTCEVDNTAFANADNNPEVSDDGGFFVTDVPQGFESLSSAVPALAAVALLPGDVDGNGVVDFADFVRLADSFGSTDAVRSDGDLSGDGRVEFDDFVILATTWPTDPPPKAVDTVFEGPTDDIFEQDYGFDLGYVKNEEPLPAF